jgi:cobalamin biosynthesis protein CobD/CbiB
MTEEKEVYPVATLHKFLEETSDEFRRFRLQTSINLVGSVVFLILVLVFVFVISASYSPHARTPHGAFLTDLAILLAAAAAVAWYFDVWRRQRGFVSRWGKRFERLQELEKKFLPE